MHVESHIIQGLSNPDAVARAAYYGVAASPTIWFDGMDVVIGPADPYATFLAIIQDHLANEMAQLSVAAELAIDAPGGTGTVTVDVTIAPDETIADPQDCAIRVVLYEDDIFTIGIDGEESWSAIARDMLPDAPLTVSTGGAQQQVVHGFTLDPGWTPEEIHAIAFVQRDTDKHVLNAGLAKFPYDVRVTALDPCVQETAGSVPAEIDVEVENTGTTADDVMVTLDAGELPVDWDVELEWDAATYPNGFTIPAMAAGQVETVRLRVVPGAAPGGGVARVTAVPAADALREVESRAFVFHEAPAILLVDDDQGADWEGHFRDAILEAGVFSAGWDYAAIGYPPADLLQLFDAVVWTTGSSANQTIGYWARFALRDYLDAGGRLLFSSQGYMSEKGVSGFASTYLRVATYLNNQGAPSATGLAGDPIGDGLSLVLSPPFLDRADTVNPAAGAVAWLQAPAGNVALRYDSGTFRTVFLPAAFDGVAAGGPDPSNRGTVMRRILYWLDPSIAVGGPEIGPPASGLALHPTVPNPFRESATVRFSVPRAGAVSVAIFDAAGRRVIDLVRGPVPSGLGEIAWEGRDATGRAVASGVYFVRLDVGGETRTRRMVRLR